MKLTFAGLLLALTVLVYANSLHGQFVFDDLDLLQNPAIQSIHSFSTVFQPGAFRPMLMLTYRLNYYFAGYAPISWHVTNLLIHSIAVLLLYGILLELGAEAPYALLGAAVFAVHPLWSEAVVSISGRSASLCGMFYFASLLLALKIPRDYRWRTRIVLGAGALLCGVLAYKTKQDALTLPLIILVFWLIRDTAKYSKAVIGLAMAGLLLQWSSLYGYLVATGRNEDLVTAGFQSGLPLAQHAPTYVNALVGYYFTKILLPYGLTPDPYVPVVTWLSLSTIASLCLLVVLCGAFYFTKDRFLRLGLAGLIVSPLLLHLVAPSTDIVLEHRAYITGLGVAILAVWGVRALAKSNRALVAVGLVVWLGLLTFSHNRIWRDSYTLWAEAVKQAPTKTRPRVNFGAVLAETNHFSEAEFQYQQALYIDPFCWAARVNLASIFLVTNRSTNAYRELRMVTSQAPSFAPGWSAMGSYYYSQGRFDLALENVHRALQLKPNADDRRKEALLLAALSRSEMF